MYNIYIYTSLIKCENALIKYTSLTEILGKTISYAEYEGK